MAGQSRSRLVALIFPVLRINIDHENVGIALIRPVIKWSLMIAVVGAVDALARGLAIDLSPVRVNVVCPGAVVTEVSATYCARTKWS